MEKITASIPQYERTGGDHLEKEYSRILTAAVINPQFCKILLSDPARALTMGFAGEPFQLNQESHTLLSAIRAQSLSEFARQLNGTLSHVGAAA
ncbi:MAG: hypothetical protein JW704_04525 [Anaerolineaceae bacterium]|nr:hypothetical protein [Anaerolineaceae bacterium]MBN2678222.1 hypothetical protein [Anaerolineaceae bacterium]